MMISKKKIIISYLLTAVLLFALFLVAAIYDLRFPRIFIAMIGGVPAGLLALLARRTQPASDNTCRRGGKRDVHGADVRIQQRHWL